MHVIIGKMHAIGKKHVIIGMRCSFDCMVCSVTCTLILLNSNLFYFIDNQTNMHAWLNEIVFSWFHLLTFCGLWIYTNTSFHTVYGTLKCLINRRIDQIGRDLQNFLIALFAPQIVVALWTSMGAIFQTLATSMLKLLCDIISLEVSLKTLVGLGLNW